MRRTGVSMTTQTTPHPYPIAGVRGVRITCEEQETAHVWTLRCPHGGVAVLRLPRLRDEDDAATFNRMVALVTVWRERQEAGFRNSYACDCGVAE